MREILFRGKRLDNGEWVYGYLIAPKFAPERTFIGHLFTDDDHDIDVVEVDPKTVGQYTGLKDCKGNKIFEGDIVQTWSWSWDVEDLDYLKTDCPEDLFLGVVKYGEFSSGGISWPAYGWYFEPKDELCASCSVEDCGTSTEENHCEIVGNIYDNPELLEVKQNDD